MSGTQCWRRRLRDGSRLAIVEAIAGAQGGRCTVSSSPAGTTFTVLLPGFFPAGQAPEPLPAEPLGVDEVAQP